MREPVLADMMLMGVAFVTTASRPKAKCQAVRSTLPAAGTLLDSHVGPL